MLHSSQLKRASEDFLDDLFTFVNCCLLHCYIPKDLIKGEVILTINNNKGI